jgi:hypothetical protein
MRRWLFAQVPPHIMLAVGLYGGVLASIVGARLGNVWIVAVGIVCLGFGWLGWTESARVYREGQRQLDSMSGRCGNCGYDLTGNVTGVCPECGTKKPAGWM